MRNRRLFKGLAYRIAVAVFVVFLAVVAFRAGVGVSDGRGLPQAPTMTQVYYAFGLFVLGGLDLGVPEGGPWWGRAMLWTAYFGCPAIATAAIVEGLGRLLRAQGDGLDDLDGHVAVVGDGKLAELYVDSFSDSERRARDILLIDPDAQGQFGSEPDADDGLRRAAGDTTSRHFAERTNLRGASLILLVAENDIINLETSLFLLEDLAVPPSRLVVHLSDISLKRDIESSPILPDPVTVFNSHEIAARHLLDEKIGAFFERTDYSDEVILAGFGRFGQSMLEILDRQLDEKFHSVVLFDRRASLKYRVFREQVDLQGDYDVHTIDGDMRDPEDWERATAHLTVSTRQPTIVLGADDDAVNLRVALWLQQRYPDGPLFVRTIGTSHLADAMAGLGRFEIENVHRRMKEFMRSSPEFRLDDGS